MMAEAFASSGKFFVCASGLAGWGNSDEIRIRKVHDRFYIVGILLPESKKAYLPFLPGLILQQQNRRT